MIEDQTSKIEFSAHGFWGRYYEENNDGVDGGPCYWILRLFGKKAKEIYEIAQFEELQKNQKHAKQLYEEIIEKYPKTDYARKANERLSVLKEKK